MGRTLFDKKLKKKRFTSNLHQLMQKSVQARKNRIISAMSGQFQSELPIFKTNRNTNRNISISSPCHFYLVLYCFIGFSWSPLPLRSAQSRCPPDILWSSLRYGRCKADIHRMSCTLVFALTRVRKHWWDDITQGKQ